MNQHDTKKHIVMLEIFIAMLLWGGSWSTSKIMVTYTSNDILAFWRFVFVFCTFIPLLIIIHAPIKVPRQAMGFLLCASCVNACYTWIFFQGVQKGLAGVGGVIVTTLLPIITYLLTFLIFRRKSNRYEVIGLCLGLLSGFFLLELHNPWSLFESGNVYFVICAFIWAVLTLILQKITPIMHPLTINLYINMIGMFIYYLLVYDAPTLLDVFDYDSAFWASLLFGACLSTAVGTTLYYRAITALGSARASAFSLIVPVSALLSSWWLLDEIPTIHTIIGGSFAMIAIYFINIHKPNPHTT